MRPPSALSAGRAPGGLLDRPGGHGSGVYGSTFPDRAIPGGGLAGAPFSVSMDDGLAVAFLLSASPDGGLAGAFPFSASPDGGLAGTLFPADLLHGGPF